jgi:ParB-like chromosome segregation protein Spo0J
MAFLVYKTYMSPLSGSREARSACNRRCTEWGQFFFRGAMSCNIGEIIAGLADLDTKEKIEAINEIKKALHAISPFKDEPVDCVLWIPADKVAANDYNPNAVAPPEMELLKVSIESDGYTQPIVAWPKKDDYEVVDGFHRSRVGKEYSSVSQRVKGYLPLTIINPDREGRKDRIASTIRHNRARGRHQVTAMSDIVVELKRRNWTDARISKELGMDQDEILRLCQITGLAEVFSDQKFSKAWDVEGEISEADFEELDDDIETYEDDILKVRTVNTNDENRIFHVYTEWECYKAGFYSTTKEGMTKSECEEAYRAFLANAEAFTDSLEHVITEWKHSCEHYLTNVSLNRIAWLGQAAACYALGIPAVYRGGFWLLTQEQQDIANNIALEYLNKWLVDNGRDTVTLDEAMPNRQSDIY